MSSSTALLSCKAKDVGEHGGSSRDPVSELSSATAKKGW